jgi:hypothetical protein
MPDLNLFFLFYGQSEHPMTYFRSKEDADRMARYYINHSTLKFTNVRVEKATIASTRSTITTWSARPPSSQLRREMDLIQWEQSKNNANRLNTVLDNHLEAISEYHSNNARQNLCLDS